MIEEGDGLPPRMEQAYKDGYEHGQQAAEAERDRLAGERDFWKRRYDEQHGTVHRLEDRVAELEGENADWHQRWSETNARLQRATEAEAHLHDTLLEIRSDWSDWDEAAALKRVLQMADDAMKGRPDHSLAALAGEDEKPPDPQREGDYL